MLQLNDDEETDYVHVYCCKAHADSYELVSFPRWLIAAIFDFGYFVYFYILSLFHGVGHCV